jgi:hypothetical protein
MKQFSVSKLKKWACASKGIILEQALIMHVSSSDLYLLTQARFQVVGVEDISLVMTCLWQIIAQCSEAAIYGEPTAIAALSAMNKITGSYASGQVPNNK